MRTNIIIPKISLDEVLEISILSIEDVKKLEKSSLRKGIWWWLRSQGYSSSLNAFVTFDGSVYEYGNCVFCDKITIRPCFSILLPNLNKGDKIFVENTLCTVIDKDLVLSDNLICFHIFDEINNNWETSSLKQFIESEEFSEMIIKGTYV